MTNMQKGVTQIMKYKILTQVYQSAQEALTYLSESGDDGDGFYRDCILSGVRSFELAFTAYKSKLSTEVTPF